MKTVSWDILPYKFGLTDQELDEAYANGRKLAPADFISRISFLIERRLKGLPPVETTISVNLFARRSNDSAFTCLDDSNVDDSST